MKTYFREKSEWVLEKSDMTHPDKTIVTVPDQALTIQELLLRAQRGQQLSISGGAPVFMDTEDFDSVDLEKLNKLDIVDSSAIVQDVAQRGNVARQTLDAEEAQRKKEKQERIRAARAEELKNLGADKATK